MAILTAYVGIHRTDVTKTVVASSKRALETPFITKAIDIQEYTDFLKVDIHHNSRLELFARSLNKQNIAPNEIKQQYKWDTHQQRLVLDR